MWTTSTEILLHFSSISAEQFAFFENRYYSCSLASTGVFKCHYVEVLITYLSIPNYPGCIREINEICVSYEVVITECVSKAKPCLRAGGEQAGVS
jgi:hypothetical protein